jgi:hypothetical protein
MVKVEISIEDENESVIIEGSIDEDINVVRRRFRDVLMEGCK